MILHELTTYRLCGKCEMLKMEKGQLVCMAFYEQITLENSAKDECSEFIDKRVIVFER